MGVDLRHGGNRQARAAALGCQPSQVLDASASLAPWTPRLPRPTLESLRDYPDRGLVDLRRSIAALHDLPPDWVLPGNGAAELFTWAARDAASVGVSGLTAPGFADHLRALRCWDGRWIEQMLPLIWESMEPQNHPLQDVDVQWVCNPHNPTGRLWNGAALAEALSRHRLLICDEAFLPLVPDGERQSLIPLVSNHPNLVVVRSLTKLFGIAGLRLGYAVAQPERLQRWSAWRDPWPVNGMASIWGEALLARPGRYQRWCRRVQTWTGREGAWMQLQLSALRGITPMPSAANFLLIHGQSSLVTLREGLERHHRILLRDCRSFRGLDGSWLRIGLQDRRGNRRIIQALRRELSCGASA